MTKDTHLSGSPARTGFSERWGGWLACVLLVAGTVALYWPVKDFNFINADDPSYISKNTHVRAGITWEGLKWASRAIVVSNWHPLTLISLMLDCQLYGLSPRGPHITNAVLHLLDSLLLFALMLTMTRRRWPAFFVAALFAWHPLHVESVAWIAERKDVLSTFFGLLTLLTYVRYVGQSKIKNQKSRIYYCLAIVLFALGLMAKPMLVTLPFVMLLLDYWPLKRSAECGVRSAESGTKSAVASTGEQLPLIPSFSPSGAEGARLVRLSVPREGGRADEGAAASSATPGSFAAVLPRLVMEKIPFFLLAAISCGLTLWAQKAGGAIIALEKLPLAKRIANAVFSYYWYIGKCAWPTRLALFYPYGEPKLDWLVWLAAAALVVSCAVALFLRKRPYLAVGWFWFLGTLVPVIGFVQVGNQGMADRYSYLPCIGLFIMVVYGAGELAAHLRHGMAGLTVIGVLTLAACLTAASQQVRYWHDGETLFRHAIAVTEGNFVAYNNLGVELFEMGKVDESAGCFVEALRWKPASVDAHFNLGNAYAALRQPQKAVPEYRAALELNPNKPRAHYFLGNELLAEGDTMAAADNYRAELALNPNHALSHYRLAILLMSRGEVGEAIRRYEAAVQIVPAWGEALNNLAWVLATQPDARFRNGPEAVKLAARVVALTHTNEAGPLDTLAAAYAEAGQFDDAVKTASQGATVARATGKTGMAEAIESRLRLYQQSQPFHLPPATPVPP